MIGKAALNDKPISLGARDPYEIMITTYAAELAGIALKDPSETRLQDAHPQLTQEEQHEWAAMQALAAAKLRIVDGLNKAPPPPNGMLPPRV